MMKRKERAADAAPRGLWIAALVLLALGLALSGELVRLHIEATSDAAYHSYCSVNETVSCDTVARSDYAVFFGVPLAVWGVFGYLLTAVIAAFGLRGRSAAPAVLYAGLSAFSLIVSAVLAAVSHYVIHAWCLVCIGTYGVNLVQMVLAILVLRRVSVRAGVRALLDAPLPVFVGAGIAGCVALGLILVYPPPVEHSLLPPPVSSSPSASKTEPPSAAAAPAAPKVEPIPPLAPGIEIETGLTEEGIPWIGAKNPVVTVTEFFDYECSHCKQAFPWLHRLLTSNPDRLRLEVRHFPLSSECNRFISRPIYPHSCVNAKLANCAGEQDRFWQAHEYLFENGTQDLEPSAFAEALSLNPKELTACMKRDNAALSRDIEAGIALELHGTPVFVVDGKVYMQYLPRSLSTILRPPADPH